MQNIAIAGTETALVAEQFRVEAPIASGGESVVVRAFDLLERRWVALKLLETTDAASGERFAREAEITSSLEHPHIVRALAAGKVSDGRRFIAYELLHGETLRARVLRLGPLPWTCIAIFAKQILSALAAVHERGIVHCDIKPSNVFVCSEPSGGEFVRLLDFGICEPTNHIPLSDGRQVRGTPRYMSPEQLAAGPLCPASDLFSLGLMLAELLSGVPVFGGSIGEILIARLPSEPTLLSEAVLRSPLGSVIERATRAERDRRYDSAHQMSIDLDLALCPNRPPCINQAA
jgi:serine/threonine-protein kinase